MFLETYKLIESLEKLIGNGGKIYISIQGNQLLITAEWIVAESVFHALTKLSTLDIVHEDERLLNITAAQMKRKFETRSEHETR